MRGTSSLLELLSLAKVLEAVGATAMATSVGEIRGFHVRLSWGPGPMQQREPYLLVELLQRCREMTSAGRRLRA